MIDGDVERVVVVVVAVNDGGVVRVVAIAVIN